MHGNAGNGAANGMAQGRVCVAGNIGARGMTMTKHNPRFEPPELWVLGSVGDYFGEFMAGGIAVVCGLEAQDSENVLGYRPLVGMVGGKVFFRGPHAGFSQADARLAPVGDADWDWLQAGLKSFLKKIGRLEMQRDTLRARVLAAAGGAPAERKGRPVGPRGRGLPPRGLGRRARPGRVDRRSQPHRPQRHPRHHHRGAAAVRPGLAEPDLRRPVRSRLPDRHPRAAPLAARARRPAGRGGRPGAGLHPLPGGGLRLPLPEPVHAVLHPADRRHGAGGHDPDRPGQHPRPPPGAAPAQRQAHRGRRRRSGRAVGRLAAAPQGPRGHGVRAGRPPRREIHARHPRQPHPARGDRHRARTDQRGAAARPLAAAARPGRHRPAARGLRLPGARHRRPEGPHAGHPRHRAGGLRPRLPAGGQGRHRGLRRAASSSSAPATSAAMRPPRPIAWGRARSR